jgi:type VII secretion-associated serine protease mycosin
VKISVTMAATVVSIVAALFTISPDFARADDVRSHEWHLKALHIADASKISTGDGVTVAVVDSGVYPHPDLRANLLEGTSVIVKSPGNGRNDQRGHGTQMASIIAGNRRAANGGVLGIARNSKILPIKASDANGRGDSDDVASGIQFALGHGAKIVNFSGAVAPSQALISAVTAARLHDVLIVAAAGNKGQDVMNAYPASISGVLAVGASTRAGKPADFTYANRNVQLCAPGTDIIAAEPKSGYIVGQGTSQATAIVSGAAALVRSKFPDLSAQEVIHRLTATATDIGAPGRDEKCGYGILNVVKALTADVPLLSSASTTSPTATPPPTTDAPTTRSAPSEAVTLPNAKRRSTNVPAVIGGVIGVLLVVGLLFFVAIRRRRPSTAQP